MQQPFATRTATILHVILHIFLQKQENIRQNIWRFQKNSLPLHPLTTSNRALSSAGLEHLPYKQRVGGSNPSAPTTGILHRTAACRIFCFYTPCPQQQPAPLASCSVSFCETAPTPALREAPKAPRGHTPHFQRKGKHGEFDGELNKTTGSAPKSRQSRKKKKNAKRLATNHLAFQPGIELLFQVTEYL